MSIDKSLRRKNTLVRARNVLTRQEYYSIGGGFVVQADSVARTDLTRPQAPYEFGTAAQLLEQQTGMAPNARPLVDALRRRYGEVYGLL